MDTTDSSIIIDQSGICDHCRIFENQILPTWNYGIGREQELKSIVDRIKRRGKGREFDCIVGMSGGVDSSYVLYLVKEKLNLRPLVFHVDAGWNSDIAVNNIERMVDGLGLDLYTEVINWEDMKELQKAYFKSGVPHIDTPQDHAFFATMYKFAVKHSVRSIITGGNYATECVRNPKEWMYFQSDASQLRDIYKKHGGEPLTSYPITNILWHKIYLPYVKGIKLYRILDFFHYNKTEATQFLKEKFGYVPYRQKHFESRFTQFYESYWLPQKFGFDTRKVQFSSLILSGQMQRDVAIEQLMQPAYDPDKIRLDFEYVASKLDMSVDDLLSCFHGPNKTYKDYSNQERLYRVGSLVMNLIGKELGGKR